MNAPLTAEDLKLGHAPIDPERVEYFDDRRAIYLRGPWAGTRVRVIREMTLVLMALRGGYGITCDQLTESDIKGHDQTNAVMRTLFRRHAVASMVSPLTRIVSKFRKDVDQADPEDVVDLRSHLEDVPLYSTGTCPHGLYEFILQCGVS